MTGTELTIDEAVTKILEQEKDHAAFLRRVITDNIVMGRTTSKLTEEHAAFRSEVLAAARVGNGPSVAAILAAVRASDARMMKFLYPKNAVVEAV